MEKTTLPKAPIDPQLRGRLSHTQQQLGLALKKYALSERDRLTLEGRLEALKHEEEARNIQMRSIAQEQNLLKIQLDQKENELDLLGGRLEVSEEQREALVELLKDAHEQQDELESEIRYFRMVGEPHDAEADQEVY